MRRELEGKDAPPPETEVCGACKAEMPEKQFCLVCEGGGYVTVEVEIPQCPNECWEFLRAWAAIEAHRLDGWLRLVRAEEQDAELEPSEVLFEALEIFNGELNRLEHAADVKRYAKRT